MTIASLLEDFATASPDIPTQSPRPEDLVGYGMGYDVGVADAADQSAQATKQLASILEDMNYGYREAQQDLLESLRPLFQMLVSRIVPKCLDAAFHAHALEAIEKAARTDAEKPINVMVHPDQMTALSKISQEVGVIPLCITADPTQSKSEVRFKNEGVETSFDAELLISELSKALSALHITEQTKDAQNG